MKTLFINLFLCANFIATIVAYYKKCYDESSLCFITNTKDPLLGSEYKLNQDDADKWCKANSSSLATIRNERVQSAIETFITDPFSKMDSDVIINGYRYNPGTWEWINGNRENIFLLSHYSGYGFLVVSSSGLISVANSRQPAYERKFICSYPSTYPSYNSDFCLTDYQLRQPRSRCYKIHSEEVTWFDARSICLNEDKSDLATFEHSPVPLHLSELRRNEEYWIGLRREQWIWLPKESYIDMKYTNWEDDQPSNAGENGLCVRVETRKWTICDYRKKHRYICIQHHVSGSTSTLATPTTRLITPSSTRGSVFSVGHSTSHFYSAPTQMRVDKATEKPTDMEEGLENKGLLLGLGIGSGFLLLLIVVIAVVAFVIHRRSRSHEIVPSHEEDLRPPPNVYTDEAPATVYAMVLPTTSDPTRPPSEQTPNQTVYAELDLEPSRKVNQRSSEPIRSPSGRSPNPVFYEELDLASKGDATCMRAAQESEYANSQLMGSVYANSAQTRV